MKSPLRRKICSWAVGNATSRQLSACQLLQDLPQMQSLCLKPCPSWGSLDLVTEHGLVIFFRDIKSQAVILGQCQRTFFTPDLPTRLAYVAVWLLPLPILLLPLFVTDVDFNKHFVPKTSTHHLLLVNPPCHNQLTIFHAQNVSNLYHELKS